MNRTTAIILSFIGIFSLALYGADRKPATDSGSSLVIVFKDGHRQTIRMADVARMEFNTSVAETHAAPVPKGNQLLPGRNHFIGKWEVGEGAGMSRRFLITLNPDGHAEKSIGASHGTWELVAGEARITWDDGWHDVIRKVGSKHEKFAYEPGKSFSDQPANVTEARATDPKPL